MMKSLIKYAAAIAFGIWIEPFNITASADSLTDDQGIDVEYYNIWEVFPLSAAANSNNIVGNYRTVRLDATMTVYDDGTYVMEYDGRTYIGNYDTFVDGGNCTYSFENDETGETEQASFNGTILNVFDMTFLKQ